jgi:hypothetical protein
MTWFRRCDYYKRIYTLAVLIALTTLAASSASGQSATSPFAFRTGQSMYIVAYRQTQLPLTTGQEEVTLSQREYLDYDLDAERKVRKRIEEWQFFRVADKPSEADFIFLVNLDESSIEGLALPFEAYRQHFKEKFDLDALREAAYGRYIIGPLKLPTLSRLADRLVEQFREKLTRENRSPEK